MKILHKGFIYESQFESMLLYHGSHMVFNKFSLNRFGNTDAGYYGHGIYLTSLEGLAGYYGSKVYTCKVHMDYPYITDSNSAEFIGELISRGYDGSLKDRHTINDSKNVTLFLKSRGYDGVIYRSKPYVGGVDSKPIKEVVVFDPNNIQIVKIFDYAINKDITEEALNRKNAY